MVSKLPINLDKDSSTRHFKRDSSVPFDNSPSISNKKLTNTSAIFPFSIESKMLFHLVDHTHEYRDLYLTYWMRYAIYNFNTLSIIIQGKFNNKT